MVFGVQGQVGGFNDFSDGFIPPSYTKLEVGGAIENSTYLQLRGFFPADSNCLPSLQATYPRHPNTSREGV